MTTTIPSLPDVAVRVRQMRLRAGLTQRQLAALAGCSLSYLSNVEAGCVPRRGDVLPRIIAALEARDGLVVNGNGAPNTAAYT